MHIGNIEITKREIILSITIISVGLLIGVIIHGAIFEYNTNTNEIYNKAIKIDSTDLFLYGMETNVGNAFVYGELKAIDPVSYSDIDGSYMYIERVEEEYTMHTRVVTKTVNGKTTTSTQTYWTWDRVGSDVKRCTKISFCNVTFDVNKVNMPSPSHISTIKTSSKHRYQYYAVDSSCWGTIFTELKDQTISDKSKFYNNSTIPDVVNDLETTASLRFVIFWIIWSMVIICIVYFFVCLDNKWLN